MSLFITMFHNISALVYISLCKAELIIISCLMKAKYKLQHLYSGRREKVHIKRHGRTLHFEYFWVITLKFLNIITILSLWRGIYGIKQPVYLKLIVNLKLKQLTQSHVFSYLGESIPLSPVMLWFSVPSV